VRIPDTYFITRNPVSFNNKKLCTAIVKSANGKTKEYFSAYIKGHRQVLVVLDGGSFRVYYNSLDPIDTHLLGEYNDLSWISLGFLWRSNNVILTAEYDQDTADSRINIPTGRCIFTGIMENSIADPVITLIDCIEYNEAFYLETLEYVLRLNHCIKTATSLNILNPMKCKFKYPVFSKGHDEKKYELAKQDSIGTYLLVEKDHVKANSNIHIITHR
jgi:hypothetical protein